MEKATDSMYRPYMYVQMDNILNTYCELLVRTKNHGQNVINFVFLNKYSFTTDIVIFRFVKFPKIKT